MLAEEGHSIKVSCRVLDVTEAGLYAWRKRPPSERVIRHAWLTDLITKVQVDPRGTFGARRVDAELTIGMGIDVGHNAVEMLDRARHVTAFARRVRSPAVVEVRMGAFHR